MTTVIMPVWCNDEDTWSITNNCILSFQETIPNMQLILVDNASKVGGGWLRKESTIYIRFNENRGFTPAINAGIKLATGDLIILANNDIRVPSNIDKVCREIFQDQSIAFVHPKMQSYDEPFNFGNLTAPTGKERWCGNSLSVTTKRFLNLMMYKETYEDDIEPYPGLFDENFGFGGGGDDWDFFTRVRRYGKQCYTNKTAFQHKMSHSLKKLGSEREKINKQNDEYFVKKYGTTKEELFGKEFPEQMLLPYLPFP